jgi:hypothetical protein
MGSLPITTKTLFFTTTHLPLFSSSNRRTTSTTTRTVYLNKRKNNKVVFASSSSSQHNQQDKNTPQFDNDDIMELKLGRYLGEDPKLTLAKVFIQILIFQFFIFLTIYISSISHSSTDNSDIANLDTVTQPRSCVRVSVVFTRQNKYIKKFKTL